MIRPEAKAAILEWREVLIGGALMIIGGHWVVNGQMLLPFIGALMGLAGLVFLFLGWRRVRFPKGGGGPGVVDVTERQISYLTAEGGAAIAIDGLARVEVARSPSGITWRFTSRGGETLAVPGDAIGAEAIFDALVSLPGINHDQALQAAKAKSGAPDVFLIWQRDKRALH